MKVFQKKYSSILLLLLFFFMVLMVRITLQYIPYHLDVGFLRIKQDYINITHWRIAFFIHVYTSIIVLFAGFTQFPNTIFKRKKKLHRFFGYVYIVNIIFVTGPTGLIMGFYANGGMSSRIAFVLLSILWIYFTAVALYKAIKRDFKAHEIYMMRSYALTLSAVTLRAWKFIIMNLFTIPPMDVYRIVAWLGWGLNLIFIEWIISKRYYKQQLL